MSAVHISSHQNKGIPPRRLGEWESESEVNQDIHQMEDNHSLHSDGRNTQVNIASVPVEAQVEIIKGPNQMSNSATSTQSQANSRISQRVFAQRQILAELKKKRNFSSYKIKNVNSKLRYWNWNFKRKLPRLTYSRNNL